MTDPSKIIGDVETTYSTNTVRHTIKYLLKEDELNDYLPELLSKAAWAPGECVVESWKKEYLAPGTWILHLTAIPMEYSTGEFSGNDFNDYTEKKYRSIDIYFPKEWFGIRTADKDDEESGILNIHGAACSAGDFLFRDASASDIGSADYSKSPFDDSNASLSPLLAGQSIKTKFYRCVFYTRRLAENLSDFIGVNGSFPAKCRPGNVENGRWKAADQELETLRDAEGKVWTKVSRSMIMAPEGALWSSDKNGGTWAW